MPILRINTWLQGIFWKVAEVILLWSLKNPLICLLKSTKSLYILLDIYILKRFDVLTKKKWSNSPLTEEQESWTILEYGKLRSYLQDRRKFREHFKLSPRRVPCINSFKSLVNRFIIEKPITCCWEGVW